MYTLHRCCSDMANKNLMQADSLNLEGLCGLIAFMLEPQYEVSVQLDATHML